MDYKRRDFVKVCAASWAILGSSITFANSGDKSTNSASSESTAAIEKSIKASFGGGFSLLSYSKSGGLTQAKIQNFGNQYTVTSNNLLDWKIVKSSLSN